MLSPDLPDPVTLRLAHDSPISTPSGIARWAVVTAHHASQHNVTLRSDGKKKVWRAGWGGPSWAAHTMRKLAGRKSGWAKWGGPSEGLFESN